MLFYLWWFYPLIRSFPDSSIGILSVRTAFLMSSALIGFILLLSGHPIFRDLFFRRLDILSTRPVPGSSLFIESY